MNPVISKYENLSLLTAQMRAAATAAEWDRLIELEKECRQRLAEIKTLDATIPLEDQALLRKAELIRAILVDNGEVRKLTEPWMEQLQRIMHSAGQEHRLHQAYSAEY